MILKTADVGSTESGKESEESDIIYKIEDVPPWYFCLVLGLQHYLTMFSGAIAMPLLITPALCIPDDSPSRGDIISTTFFASGLASLLQATFGCRFDGSLVMWVYCGYLLFTKHGGSWRTWRENPYSFIMIRVEANLLPIIQGPSFSFLVPILAILSLPQWQCPSPEAIHNMTDTEADEVWMSRMREVQGAILVGAVIEVLVGLTGLIGFLMKWITPLSVVPTITLIGLGLFKEAATQSAGNWWISSFTMFLLIIFSQHLAHVTIPKCTYKRHRGWKIERFAFFKLFPVILSIGMAWGFCAILTATNVFSEEDPARTDLRLSALNKTNWVRVPYPGQWGMPTFNIGPALGIIAGVLASAIESVGDYLACARLAGAPTPPVHAINRGIMVEGFGCIISGFCGTASGLTSFSQNVGAIAITKVGSRRVTQFASVIIVIFGMIAKFGVLFITIPSPIMGGVFFIMFAFITGVGLSNLQYVNLNSSRNLFILGFSIFMGLSIPFYLDGHPDTINTGNKLIDQILAVLLKTSMFIGGFFGCFLDNTIPASETDRQLNAWGTDTTTDENGTESKSTCYDMPFGMKYIRRSNCLKYLPISPTYKNQNINISLDCFRRRKKHIQTSDTTLSSTRV